MSPCAQPNHNFSVTELCWAHTSRHVVLFLEAQEHTGAGGWRHNLGYSCPVTCVVLTVALIELHQHGGWDDEEVPQRWHHRVHHHREPLTQAAQTLQHTIDLSCSPGKGQLDSEMLNPSDTQV